MFHPYLKRVDLGRGRGLQNSEILFKVIECYAITEKLLQCPQR